MITVELEYEQPTKNKVRFHHELWGTVYVPNSVFEQLGRPEQITMRLEAATAAALKAV